MSRLRDQFIASVPFIRRVEYFDEMIKSALQWKKIGGLDAEEYDQIVAAAEKGRRMIAILRAEKIRY